MLSEEPQIPKKQKKQKIEKPQKARINLENQGKQKMQDKQKKTTTTTQIVKIPDKKIVKHPISDFPIVAIGASAGGLEAFTQFLNNMPKDSGVALILIQHLDPNHSSSLVELLARQSVIPIREVKDGDRVQPDQAYVIPPGQTMSIRNRTLYLTEQMEHPGLTHSINVFFSALADDVKGRAVGIILSGTGSDGTDGLRAIQAQDGLVIVQDPKTAKYDGMPRSAIDSGFTDYILSPEDMPSILIEYLRQSFFERSQQRKALRRDDDKLKSIFSILKARTGRDFSGYKISSISRRIERRMSINKIGRIEDYLRFLRENLTEVQNLMKDFLIQVTSFFRDEDAFVALKQYVTKILLDKPEGTQLRVWTSGCSTGEEAYSIAIIFLECIKESGLYYGVQIFGTDLNSSSINFARSGVYPETIVKDVSAERLNLYFNKLESSYQINKNVRDCVIFAVHDLVTDAPYSRMDLISVRNLLIYFDTDLQKKVLPVLHYSLNEKGLLFLGTAETIGEFNNLFTTKDSKWRIYQARNKKKEIPLNFLIPPKISKSDEVNLSSPFPKSQSIPNSLLLLEALPPSVLIDHNYQVLFTHGDISRYLRISQGKLSNHILDMVSPDSGRVLSSLLHEVSQYKKDVVSDNIKVGNNKSPYLIKITVRPLTTFEGYLIITFEDLPLMKRSKAKGVSVSEAQHLELEHELQRIQDTLRNTIEELKTTNEELRSANEQYMSANEELRSANEELETSREELQSVNEELTTLNTEDQIKNEELNILNNDIQNLVNLTGVATIFLDAHFKIRRFTPAASKLFKFIDSDIGRPVENITSPLKQNILVNSARQVLEDLIPVEQEVQTKDNKWYSLRIIPYRTLDNNIAGVVISFVDINQIKSTLQYAQDIIDTIREPLLVLDDKLMVISGGQAFYKKFRVTPEEVIGKVIFDLGNRQWDIPQLRTILEEVVLNNSIFEGYQVEHEFPVIGNRVMLLNARRINDVKATESILLVIDDITGQSGIEPFSKNSKTRSDKTLKEG